jgi:hypothetical protein
MRNRQFLAVLAGMILILSSCKNVTQRDVPLTVQPHRIGTLPTPGGNTWFYTMAIQGNYAYVASSLDFTIVDISDLTNPTLLSTLPVSDYSVDVKVSGNYAYVTIGSNGSDIIDISDPLNPTLAGTLDPSIFGWNGEAAVDGNYMYNAYGNIGMVIMDVSNPAAPVMTNPFILNGANKGPTCILKDGNYIYTGHGLAAPNQFNIIDVSNPAAPVVTGSLTSTQSVQDIVQKDNYLFLATGSNGVQIVDVTDPTTPVVSTTLVNTGNAVTLLVSGNFLFVGNDSDGVEFYDITDPLSPVYIDRYDYTGGNYNMKFTFVDDRYLLIPMGSSIDIIDIYN